jgi:hypothetical protein
MAEGAPATIADHESGHDPAALIDRAIMAAGTAVISHHGLIP